MFEKRLKELRKNNNVSQANLSKALGISQQAVGKWETGRCTPAPQMIAKLAEFFKVSTDYLIGIEKSDDFQNTQENFRNLGEHLIPIIGTVKAGYDALAFEEDYGSEYANVKNPENYFYLIVKGDSMMPRINDGDLALVRRQNTLENGDLGVVVYGDGSGTLKKFIVQENAIILQPFNSSYQAQIIMGEDINNIFIAGKVVETKTKW